MKPSQILTSAKILITNPNKWTKGTFGRLNGIPVPVQHAECYCAVGAVMKIHGIYSAQLSYLSRVLPRGFKWVDNFNDDSKTTHADILELFEKAIILATSEGN